MRAATPALIAHLNSTQQFVMADMYAFTLDSGIVLRYTTWDTDLIYNGNNYSSSGPLITRSKSRIVLGVEVETLDLIIAPAQTDLIAGVPFLAAAIRGALDGAYLHLDRIFMSAGAVVGGYINFTGAVADITVSRTEIKMSVKSPMNLLNVQFPKNIIQPGCLRTLYDTGCGVVRSSVAVNSSVTSASTTVINTPMLVGFGLSVGYFDQGYVEFTSGALIGVSRTIKSSGSGQLHLLNPLAAAPSPGDTFTAYPGCDRSQATCSAKFNNIAKFRGFPYVPMPETAA